MSSMMMSLPEPSGDVGKATSTIGINSSLPPGTQSANAALRVRTLASEKIEGSWKALQAEFDVQKMIWQSLSLQKKVDMNKAAQVQTTLEGAMAARVKSPTMAIRTIEEQLKQHKDLDLLGNSMMKAMAYIIEQANLTVQRSQLAERLDTACVPATLPTQDVEKRELEALLRACQLEDTKLENAVRKILLLPMPVKAKAAPTTEAQKLPAKKSPAKTMDTAGARLSSSKIGSGTPAQKVTSSKRASSTGGIKANPQNKPIAHRIRNDEVYMPFDPPSRAMIEL
jgi:hypothetical protein